jgi:hypothetical protein
MTSPTPSVLPSGNPSTSTGDTSLNPSEPTVGNNPLPVTGVLLQNSAPQPQTPPPQFSPQPLQSSRKKFQLGLALASILIVTLGLATALALTRFNQDVRQQAFRQSNEGYACSSAIGDITFGQSRLGPCLNNRQTRYLCSPSGALTQTEQSCVSPIDDGADTDMEPGSPPPDQLTERCGTAGERVCRFNYFYQCSTPQTQYQKTTERCGVGTENAGATVTCCVEGQEVELPLMACQAEGTVGRCATQANVCVTAFGEIPYGSEQAGSCNIGTGVRTIISCSATGQITSRSSSAGCIQLNAEPTPAPSTTANTSQLCYVASDRCARGSAQNCAVTFHYNNQQLCLNTIENLNVCFPEYSNCSDQPVTVWVP